jgi:hypothetical protein
MHGVVDGTGGAGEVEDIIDSADIERFANVFLYEFEARIISEMRDVCRAASEQVVDDDNTPAFSEQGVTQMRS